MEKPGETDRIVLGVVSDTHGRLDKEVAEHLKGVDHIIHAGDIGSSQVLTALRALAPVTAVRGNCDLEGWASALPAQTEVTLGGARILVGHIGGHLRQTLAEDRRMHLDGASGAIRVVVTGHTHRAANEERDGVLFLNPGSAGQGRFGLPRTMAKLIISPASSRSDGEAAPRPAVAARLEVEFTVLG